MEANSFRSQPYVVALTGGIASGKSTVSRLFEKLGVPVVDTDLIARDSVQKGSPSLARIKAQFGAEIIDESGELKRRKLREIIFSDAKKRAQLEAILHPAILEEARRQVLSLHTSYCIVVIPLLAEVGVPHWVHRVLLVETPRALQLSRLRERDRLSEVEAAESLEAQASQQQRRAIADDIILNEGGVEDLRTQVNRLHARYVQLVSTEI